VARRTVGRRASGLVVTAAAGLALSVGACTGATGGATRTSSAVRATSPTAAVPKAPQAVPEAPQVVSRDAYAFRTATALRTGATYRLRMPGNLSPVAPGSHLVVEVTPSAARWWLYEQGIVVQAPTFAREAAGLRVMEPGELPFGPCQAQATPRPAPGPAPADLAREILARYAFSVVDPITPTTRFGGAGVHLTAQLEDPQASLCDNGGVMTYRPMAAQHQLVELWVVVVDGERVVIERSWFPDTGSSVLAAQQVTLATLRLVPH
jgi:hypothetical protein